MTAKGFHCTRSHPRKIAYLPRLIADSPGTAPLAAGIRSIGIRAARNVLRSRCNVDRYSGDQRGDALTSRQRTTISHSAIRKTARGGRRLLRRIAEPQDGVDRLIELLAHLPL